jgi:hypothetical protein
MGRWGRQVNLVQGVDLTGSSSRDGRRRRQVEVIAVRDAGGRKVV